ncbi:dCTP deaminase [Catalinimonas alkaloidigena]|uniref:dCTP deaminase n=1 Tax=Catalinimonas alkaloidigena TaxID=1075417 RepID=UPI002404BE0A|nr:dCTP deaminase [Catalinimonas alkaloidigena]MDF9797689.1 dCTP deaminase [Catalinimonas alkaloidigena]
MILSGREIVKLIDKEIFINPFSIDQINPNSYNLRLHNQLLVYEDEVLDMKKDNDVKKVIIPEEGLILQPNRLYLGRTIETIKAEHHVPKLEGRSSIGRLGIMVHLTAGLGNIGSDGYWTLELACIQPVRIYPGVAICQIYFEDIKGEYDTYKSEKYHHGDIQPSLIYQELQ